MFDASFFRLMTESCSYLLTFLPELRNRIIIIKLNNISTK